MCDITGHGVQAAIVVSTCRSVLSMLKINRPDSFARSDFVLQFTNVLNQVLYSQGKGSHTTTLCGVTFDSEKNKVVYISCGHPPAFLFTPGEQKPTALVSRNNNLGLNVESSFLLQEKAFSPQQELVIYSDGIQVKGIHRIIAKYLEERETLGLEPEDCVDMVCRSDPQKEVMELQDDVSLVFIKYEA
jgi:serine phosphatase RsbU (regulator of sigma subunit)